MHVCVLLKNLAYEELKMYIKGTCIVFISSLQPNNTFPSSYYYLITELVSENYHPILNHYAFRHRHRCARRHGSCSSSQHFLS
jgi:hypothetical protein